MGNTATTSASDKQLGLVYVDYDSVKYAGKTRDGTKCTVSLKGSKDDLTIDNPAACDEISQYINMMNGQKMSQLKEKY